MGNSPRFVDTYLFSNRTAFREVNYELIPQYVLYLQRCGVTGILSKKFVLNSFTYNLVKCFVVNDIVGEGMSLTIHERMKLTEEWLKYGQAANMTVMVQVGGAPLKDVQELVIATYYYKTLKISILVSRRDMQKRKRLQELSCCQIVIIDRRLIMI